MGGVTRDNVGRLQDKGRSEDVKCNSGRKVIPNKMWWWHIFAYFFSVILLYNIMYNILFTIYYCSHYEKPKWSLFEFPYYEDLPNEMKNVSFTVNTLHKRLET